ncbi:MAG: cyanophycinase [Gemmatimonadota bacterium]
MNARRALQVSLFVVLALAGTTGRGLAQVCDRPCVGPQRGAIVAAGGGDLGQEIYQRFLALAGGADAHIVLIPTAGAEDGSHDAWTALEHLREAGASHIEVLHTRNRKIADLEAFTRPLREASGVWISGGRQHRLMEVYLHTRTQEELGAVLARGGVIAGNSAGASALASYLIRGGEDGKIVVDHNHDEGFGFLRGVALDQHLIARGRENDLIAVLMNHPELLGIGVDEATALVITGDMASVIGKGRVAIYDVTDPLALIPLRYLQRGEVYDLGARQVVLTTDESMEGPGS